MKSVKVVFDPRPNASTNPAAVVEFQTVESSSHVLSMASSGGQGLRIGGNVVEPAFAKVTAPIIAMAWAAQREASLLRETEYRDERGFSRQKDNEGRGRDDRDHTEKYGRGERSDRQDGGHYGSGDGGRGRGRDERPMKRAVVAPPKWPPSFEEDGAVWVFDPASMYFLHRATEMFYEPKSKWYSIRPVTTFINIFFTPMC